MKPKLNTKDNPVPAKDRTIIIDEPTGPFDPEAYKKYRETINRRLATKDIKPTGKL